MPSLVKYGIGSWIRLGTPLGYTKERNKNKNHSDHGIQGPQKMYLKAYIIHWHGPTCFVLREAKNAMLRKTGAHGKKHVVIKKI